MAGAGILVILFDMATGRKGILPAVAFMGLLVPFAFSLVQAFDLGNQLDLVRGAGAALDAGEASILAGSLSVDRFALFFNFLVLAATGLVVLASTDYVRRMERFQGEYYGLILLSATGMMMLAAAHRVGHDLHLAGAGNDAAGGAGRLHDDPAVQRGRG